MYFPPIIFYSQDFSNLFTYNNSNQIISDLIPYQTLCKKLLKFENKESNFQWNVINWIKSLTISQLTKYCSFQNQWFIGVLHEMILISIHKNDIKFKFKTFADLEKQNKDQQNDTKYIAYINYLCQKDSPNFSDYFCDYEEGLISLSRSAEQKLKKRFLSNIRYITLSSNSKNNTNNNNNYNNSNEKENQKLFNEYNNIITLSYEYLSNSDKLIQAFLDISKKSAFKNPIEVESQLCKTGKKNYYNLKLPNWLGEYFTLPELLCAYFEQSILINYQYYLLYKQEINILYYDQFDELLDNINKLVEFIKNSKDNKVEIFQSVKPEEIRKMINDNSIIKQIILDKKSIEDHIRQNIGIYSYNKKVTIKTSIANTLTKLEKLFIRINGELNFVLSLTFIEDSIVFTAEDFAMKSVYETIIKYWRNKTAEDLLNDIVSNNNSDSNKKKKRKKKKKKDKNDDKNNEIEDISNDKEIKNGNNDNNDNNIEIENEKNIINLKEDNDDIKNNILDKKNENKNNIKDNEKTANINDINNKDNKDNINYLENEDSIINIKEKEETKTNSNSDNKKNAFENELVSNSDNYITSKGEEIINSNNKINEEDSSVTIKNNDAIKETINDEENFNENSNNKKKKEKNFFLYPAFKDKKKKNKQNKKKDKNQNNNNNIINNNKNDELSTEKQELYKDDNNGNGNQKEDNKILEEKKSDNNIIKDEYKNEIILNSSSSNRKNSNDDENKDNLKKNKNGVEYISSKQKNKFNIGMKLKNMIKDNSDLIIPKNYQPHDNIYNKLKFKNQTLNSQKIETQEKTNTSNNIEDFSINQNINEMAGSNYPRFTSLNFQSKKKGRTYKNKHNNNLSPYSFIPNDILELSKEILDYKIKVNKNKEFLQQIKEKYIKNMYEQINIILIDEKVDFLCSFYGSTISGLSIENSDIDILVKLRENKNEKNYIHNIMEKLVDNLKKKKINYVTTINPIFSASVPVIKLECDLSNDESFSHEINNLLKKCEVSYNDITKLYFDITFFEVENEQNKIPSELMIDYIKEYTIIYPEIIDIIYIMKRFLFIRKLNKSYQGGISSYSLFLLTLAFVKDKNHSNNYNNNYEISIGSLLIEYLYFYTNFNFYNNVIQPNQDDNIFSIIEDEPNFKKSNLNIIDPITGLNVAKSTFKIEEIQKAFREGLYKILGHSYSISGNNIKNDKKILENFFSK